MKKIISFLLSLSFVFMAHAQQYEATIAPIAQSGLHQLVLPPSVISSSQNNTGHLRIYNSAGKENPFIVYQRKIVGTQLHEVSILSKKILVDSLTSVVIANEKQIDWNHVILKIANTGVVKNYNISGSNDQKEWFGLVDNEIIGDLEENTKTSTNKTFFFPLNNYAYLKIDFLDKNSSPINVLNAFLDENYQILNEETKLENFRQTVTQDNENHQTRITIAFEDPQQIDEIAFTISAPNHYLRGAYILEKKVRKTRRREETFWEQRNEFTLRSKSVNRFMVNALFAKEFTIVIDNENNPELQIDKISFWQYPVRLLTDLNANEKYTLSINNQLTTPKYDLAASGVDETIDYPSTTIKELQSLASTNKSDAPKNFWQNKWFMWGSILLAMFLIGYFSLGLIKDLNKKE